MKSSALRLLALASFAPCLISSQDAPLPPEDPASTSLVFVTHGPPRPVIPLPGKSATSLADIPGNDEPTPDDDPDAAESGSSKTKSPGDVDGNASSAATPTGQDENPSPIDEESQPAVSQTQAPSEGESTVTQDVPGPPQVTSGPAGPKSTAEGDGPPVTAAPVTETEGEQATVTGSDDEVVTWSAVRDPEHIDNTKTITQTDDDGAIVPIFPGGWWWSRLDGLKGGPLPTGDPKPIDKGKDDPEDDDKDEDDDDDDEEEGCTTTAPPKCTLTLSYYTGEDGERTSTRIGSCAPVTGCVSGEQSTTTTTVASDVPRITGVLEKHDFGREDVDLGPMEEDTVKYFAEMFKKWGISSNSTEAEPPKPSCDMYAYGADAECMELFAASFCDTVEGDNNEAVSRKLTYEDVVGDAKRVVATGAERRSLRRRKSKCSSHEFDFEWTGSDGSCDLSCSKAYSQLQSQCHRSLYFAGLAKKGSIDIGCGTYSYRVSKKADSASTTLPSATSQAKTKTADPKPTTTDVKFEIQNLQCNNEDDFRGHVDISSGAAYDVIFDACTHSDKENLYMTSESEPYVKEFKDTDSHKHRVTWSWIDGCSMKNEKVSVLDPLDEGLLSRGVMRCVMVLIDAWFGCDNGGVGGSEDVGCVRYKLDSGI
ncbi:uncharacterized protein FPRO_03589 [Fusarium proliferatum ET1]|uniref:Uncharacterized protein n=1 Tax=Fusarium proliferatum (strain ET1) TaxID=1227346 RepID=A0A1L7V5M8_FUSPR|nr:uncharacterized protein FPRO_03589 [Fusarium proliferatum ET1]CZR36151.1 uncharacterized protein FPRO_03589 [Fusarium proliferatum ET1]